MRVRRPGPTLANARPPAGPDARPMRVRRPAPTLGQRASAGRARRWANARPPAGPDAGQRAASVAGYVTDRASLRPDAFLRLPPGSTRRRLARHTARRTTLPVGQWADLGLTNQRGRNVPG
jgi:hypothetical protein